MAALSLVPAACFSQLGSGEEPAEFAVTTEGGVFVVEDGILTGMTLRFPDGALADPIDLRVSWVDAAPVERRLVVGPAARIEPEDVALRRPVTVSLPYESALVPLGAGDLVVLQRGREGRIAELTPFQVRQGSGYVDVQLTAFGTVWVASPPGAASLAAERYFPLGDGNRWEFATGVELQLEERPEIANLTGGAWVWTLRAGSEDLGFYLRPLEGGGIEDHGRESASQGFQEILDTPLVMFPGELSAARRVFGQATSTVYAPIGSATAIGTGSRALRSDLLGFSSILTPVGRFDDALELRLQQAWDLAGTAGALDVTVWLAPDIGPVQVRLGGGPDLPLVEGFVDGRRVVGAGPAGS